MKILDNLMTVQMEPQEYQKKLDNYRNRMFFHVGIVILVEIMIRMGVHYFICFAVAGIILIDEVRRLTIVKKIIDELRRAPKVTYYRVDSDGFRHKEDDGSLFFFLIAGFIYIMLGYAFAIYFLFVDGARVAFAAYKANKVYGLGINQMPYYIIAIAGSVGLIVLRYLCLLILG